MRLFLAHLSPPLTSSPRPASSSSPSNNARVSHKLQIGVVPNVRHRASEVGEAGKAMPLPQEVCLHSQPGPGAIHIPARELLATPPELPAFLRGRQPTPAKGYKYPGNPAAPPLHQRNHFAGYQIRKTVQQHIDPGRWDRWLQLSRPKGNLKTEKTGDQGPGPCSPVLRPRSPVFCPVLRPRSPVALGNLEIRDRTVEDLPFPFDF
jgi:hypothetical protein